MGIKVNNVPNYAKGKFIVAREVDGELWFYGAWSDEKEARSVSRVIDDAVVVEPEDTEL